MVRMCECNSTIAGTVSRMDMPPISNAGFHNPDELSLFQPLVILGLSQPHPVADEDQMSIPHDVVFNANETALLPNDTHTNRNSAMLTDGTVLDISSSSRSTIAGLSAPTSRSSFCSADTLDAACNVLDSPDLSHHAVTDTWGGEVNDNLAAGNCDTTSSYTATSLDHSADGFSFAQQMSIEHENVTLDSVGHLSYEEQTEPSIVVENTDNLIDANNSFTDQEGSECSPSHMRYSSDCLQSSNLDLADDGYMDEIYVGAAAASGDTQRQMDDQDLDANLDDFIDADMPHNVHSSVVVGSESSSSLSSFRDEPVSSADDYPADCSAGQSSSAADDVQNDGGKHLSPSAGNARPGSLRVSSMNGVNVENGNRCETSAAALGCRAAVQESNRQFESTSDLGGGSSHPFSECSFSTPPASLPSPNYELFSAMSCVTSAPDEDAFDDVSPLATHWWPATDEQCNYNSVACRAQQQNECIWLPFSFDTATKSTTFGCRSCIDVVDTLVAKSADQLSNWYRGCRQKTSQVQLSPLGSHTYDRMPWYDERGAQNGMRRLHSVGGSCDGDCSQRQDLSTSSLLLQMSSSLTFAHSSSSNGDLKTKCDGRHSRSVDVLTNNFSNTFGASKCPSYSDTSSDEILTPANIRELSDRLSPRELMSISLSAVRSSVPTTSSLDAVQSSVCGMIAVMHVLHMLGIEDKNKEVSELMHSSHSDANELTPSSQSKVSLCDFLASSSRTGVSADQIIAGLSRITGKRVYGRFFSFYPKRRVHLLRWLASWMKLGAVPLATLKFENGMSSDSSSSPDAWRHLAIYNVLPEGVVIGDVPIVAQEDAVCERLIADSTLRIRRAEVISRWNEDCDLGVLAVDPDKRWQQINILGQVINVLRESHLSNLGYRPQMTPYVTVPTHHHSGITLFATVQSAAYAKLQQTCDLPRVTADSYCSVPKNVDARTLNGCKLATKVSQDRSTVV